MVRRIELIVLLFFVDESLLAMAVDVSDVTWNHEVDNLSLLRDAIQDSVSMFVIDICLGPKPGSEADVMNEPVPLIGTQLSHGDITLESWLDTLLRLDPQGGHGIKLVFQDPDAILPSLKELRKRDYLIHFPIFLHGEVLDGPENTTATLYMAPVAGDFLLRQSDFLVPLATVSLGWTTAFQRTPGPQVVTGYSWKDVADMASICRCYRQGHKPDVTFLIRAVFVKDSMDHLKWLLDAVPSSSLTVWSSIDDVVVIDDLLLLRRTFPFDRVYYDLPRYADQEFRRRKNTVAEPDLSSPVVTMTSYNWVLLPYKYPDCKRQPQISKDSIVIEYLTEPISLLFTDRYNLPVTVQGVLVPYMLYDQQHMKPYETNHFTVFLSTDPMSRVDSSTPNQANRRALTYTANNRIIMSDCTVQFLVRITEYGVTCAVYDGCDARASLTSNSSRNADCNAFGVVGNQPVNIGLQFDGWRGWVVYNLTINSVNSGPVHRPWWNCVYGMLLAVTVFLCKV